ncbi:AmmeMemoRadiSam system radical SAM enzyme [Corallincola luteus]|uniref:AmmeMemoRadiSam system radical SAM enzyme n=1 Tax=Corallincola luteus TaxID=1775177 RepID=A0ABY2AN76_9GAMM|nr:AmmeMemoRadiSam system radical SAM enzyme [Corallincola luteus]TCI04654.1 AmmeMemoRadiSam system radical SAM enzyme [Corallincola luteus]
MTAPPSSDYHPTQYWQLMPDKRVQCTLCPKLCTLREGKRGACYVRMAHAGKIVLTSYGRSSGFCIDPIEKKPLNHFYPGSSVLSFGTAGCNLGCKFCQNWDISKSREMDTLAATANPQQIVAAATRYQCRSVAFTYNDPVIFLEYATDVAQACREQQIEAVAVSAGYINPLPRADFYQAMSAVNIDLKAFTERFYRKLCAGHLAPVLDTLLYLKHETQVWLEITNLIIPGENDSAAEITAMCEWLITHLGADVPLHFSAFHPDFKMRDTPSTPKEALLGARDIAKQIGLHHVYLGNIHHSPSDSSYCANCGERLIERDWYQLGEYKLTADGCCPKCQSPLAGRFHHHAERFGAKRIPVSIKG